MYILKQIPAALGLRVASGDDFGATITLPDDITSDTITAAVSPTGGIDVSMIVTKTDASKGVLTIALASAKTLSLKGKLCTWGLTWTRGGAARKILAGPAEFV